MITGLVGVWILPENETMRTRSYMWNCQKDFTTITANMFGDIQIKELYIPVSVNEN